MNKINQLFLLYFSLFFIFYLGCNDKNTSESENLAKLVVENDTINFSKYTLQEQIIILNRGTVELNWTIESYPHWLIISKLKGSTLLSDTLSISINPDSLDFGDYSGKIQINSNGGYKEIVLFLSYQKPELKISTDVIYFSRDYHTESVKLENMGGSILVWNIAQVPDWITVSKMGDSLRAPSDSVTFSINFNNVQFGEYKSTIDILSNGGNAQVTVNFYYEQVIEIFPGTGAAKINIGDAFRDISKIYGTPPYYSYKETADHLYQHRVEYTEKGLTFIFKPQNSSILIPSFTVESIYVTNPYDGLLETNLGLNSALSDILAVYGEPDEKDPVAGYYKYNIGITFYIDDNSLVSGILIFSNS